MGRAGLHCTEDAGRRVRGGAGRPDDTLVITFPLPRPAVRKLVSATCRPERGELL